MRDKIDSDFLHTVILSSDVQRQIEMKVHGIAQKTLNLSAIKELVIPLPTLERQKRFTEISMQAAASKSALQHALAALQKTYRKLVSERLG